MPEWISAKDKLPNDDRNILVTVRPGRVPLWTVLMSSYNASEGKFLIESSLPGFQVLAWMDLPEPYKEE